MAPAENKNKDTEGGDDLGTMDEIRVFKDEGEFEEEDAADERFHEIRDGILEFMNTNI